MTTLIKIDPAAISRALIGFDTMFDQLERRFASQVNQNYPPHNVLKLDETHYIIEIAVSGFSMNEVAVEVDQGQLVIRGESRATEYSPEQYLHRGLSSRDFTKTFTLAEFMEIEDANIKDGILRIYIQRLVPETLKPRQIKIRGE